MRIGLLGAYGMGDMGDEAILESVLDDLRTHFPSSIPELLPVHLRDSSSDRSVLPVSAFRHSITRLSRLVYGPDSPCPSWLRTGVTSVRRWLKEQQGNRFVMSASAAGVPLGATRNGMVEKLMKCDALWVIGGGFLNSVWGPQMYPIISAVVAAAKVGKPVIFSGQTIGPLESHDAEVVNRGLSVAKLIGIRDLGQSRAAITSASVQAITLSMPDDAFFLSERPVGWVKGMLPFVVVQIHKWTHNEMTVARFMEKVKGALLEVMPRMGVSNIVFLPMSHDDIKLGLRFEQGLPSGVRCHLVGRLLPPRELKYIVCSSTITICTRHHPHVFALSTRTPFLAFIYDEYYRQKICGHVEVCGCDPDVFTLDVNATVAGIAEKLMSLGRSDLISGTLERAVHTARHRKQTFWQAAEKVLSDVTSLSPRG